MDRVVVVEAVKGQMELLRTDFWDEIIGMRNKIAHEYFGIDHQIIWKTIQDDL